MEIQFKDLSIEIYLKWGTIKRYDLRGEFYNTNRKLCEEFSNLYDELFEGCCDLSRGSQRIQSNKLLQTKLCDMLDKFFDLGVTIINDWDGEIYNSKESYRDYIMNYGE